MSDSNAMNAEKSIYYEKTLGSIRMQITESLRRGMCWNSLHRSLTPIQIKALTLKRQAKVGLSV